MCFYMLKTHVRHQQIFRKNKKAAGLLDYRFNDACYQWRADNFCYKHSITISPKKNLIETIALTLIKIKTKS